MNRRSQSFGRAVDAVSANLLKLEGEQQSPVIVAIDGRSGVGKSAVSALVSARTGASVIRGDDFYAGGTAEEWDVTSPAEIVERCVDWGRQRVVLSALKERGEATWRPYDWSADDGRLGRHPLSCKPNGSVLLEGLYSARHELADLVDIRILLHVSPASRHKRLALRDGVQRHSELEARWSPAEDYYFTYVMPPGEFDLIVGNSD